MVYASILQHVILTYGGTLKDGVGGAEGLDGAFGINFSNDELLVCNW